MLGDTEATLPQRGPLDRMLRRTFLSLRNRNFRLYFVGQTISNTGNWLTNVALTLLVLSITGSGLDVGLLAACQYGPILLLSAWAGAIADRSDKRLMLFATQSLEMLQSAGLAVLAFLPHTPLPGLYALALFGGLLLAFDNPLRRSFVNEMVRGEDVPNAVVLNSTIVNASRIFGPALAGLLIVTVGYGWCFAIDAATYLAVIWCLYQMNPEHLFREAPKQKRKGEIREGLRYVFSSPTLWISFCMLAAIGTLTYNFSVTFPLFVTDALHRSTVDFTVIYSVFSLGAVVCALIIANRGLVRLEHAIAGAAALGAMMLLFAASPNVYVATLVVFFLGMASILYMTSTTALAQIEAERSFRGRVLALQSILVAGTTPIGAPFLGWLADTLGGRAPIIVGALVCLLAAGFGYISSREVFDSKRAA